MVKTRTGGRELHDVPPFAEIDRQEPHRVWAVAEDVDQPAVSTDVVA